MDNPGIEVKNSNVQGKGVFATRFFDVSEIVYKYKRGKQIKRSEINFLSEYEQEHIEAIDADTYELIQPPGSNINHSCDPNIVELDRIGYALKPINKDEELSVDYRIKSYDNWQMECNYGSKYCQKTITCNFFSMSLELQKKYLRYSPKFIQEEFMKNNIKKI